MAANGMVVYLEFFVAGLCVDKVAVAKIVVSAGGGVVVAGQCGLKSLYLELLCLLGEWLYTWSCCDWPVWGKWGSTWNCCGCSWRSGCIPGVVVARLC